MFKSKLKEVLKKKGYGTREIARATGLSPGTINVYSKPRVNAVHSRVANLLMKELGVSFYDLFEYEEDPIELEKCQAA